MKRPGLYLAATRPRFFPAVIVPVLVGAAAAWHVERAFDLYRLLVTIVAAVLYHGGMNALNDYFDHKSGADEANRSPLTPFTGGSRVIQKGLVPPREVLALAVSLITAGSAAGLYLAFLSGPLVVLIGAAGLLTGIFYSAPPLYLAGRGLGEAAVALDFGILAVTGSYCVQAGSIGAEAVAASLPLAFLIAAVLYINEFPDYEGDRTARKKTLIVRLGPRAARWGLGVIFACAYLSIAAAVAAGLLPAAALLACLPAAAAARAGKGLVKEYAGGERLIPHIKATIAAHSLTGLILSLSLALA